MELDKQALTEYQIIIGCDEVGRGPIAGPVVAGSVRLDASDKSSEILSTLLSLNVTDSKKLSTKKRKKILSDLNIDLSKIKLGESYTISSLGSEISFCLFEHDHEEIDKLNILQASLSAMKITSEILLGGTSCAAKVFVDGNKALHAEFNQEPVVKGDSKYIVIALASIIAKEFRDEKMGEFDALYPGYNLKKNAGYPTKEHKDAVQRIGISPIHRKSFKGVKEFV